MVKDVQAEHAESGFVAIAGWERVRAHTRALLWLLWLGLIKPRGSQMVAHEETCGNRGKSASTRGFSQARLSHPLCPESSKSLYLSV